MVDYVNVRYLSFFVLILLGLSSIAFSFINSAFFLLIVFYLLRITGQGMSTHTSSTFIAKTFSSMRGKAIAVTVLGRAFGEMIMPITALLLIAFVGWRNAWIYTGLFILFIIAPYVFYLLKQRDIYEPDLNKKLNTTIYENQINYRRSDVIKNKFFYLILSSILAPPFICTGIFFHSYHLIEIKGWSTEIYALTMPIFSLLLIIFVIFSGWAVDKWSAKDLTSFYLIPLAIGCIILAIGKNEVAMILFMVCAGATTGFATSIAGSLWAELYGTKYLGEVKALVMSCVVASTAIAPGIMGYLIDISVSLSDQILVCSVYMIMITGLLLWKRKAI
jgi:sugar phosphate permease